jgi:hypothetical protein
LHKQIVVQLKVASKIIIASHASGGKVAKGGTNRSEGGGFKRKRKNELSLEVLES